MAEATPNSVQAITSPEKAVRTSLSAQPSVSATGGRCTRLFSKAGQSPYNEVACERRTASITDASGGTIF